MCVGWLALGRAKFVGVNNPRLDCAELALSPNQTPPVLIREKKKLNRFTRKSDRKVSLVAGFLTGDGLVVFDDRTTRQPLSNGLGPSRWNTLSLFPPWTCRKSIVSSPLLFFPVASVPFQGAEPKMSKAPVPELKKYMDKRVFIQLNGNRKVTGILRGSDHCILGS